MGKLSSISANIFYLLMALPMAPSNLRLRTITGGLSLGVGVLLLLTLIFVLPVWVNVGCRHSPAGIGRGPTNCVIRGSSLVGIPWRNRQIENAVGAELNLQTVRPGWVYRLFLYTYEEAIPLASYSVRYRQAEKAQSQLKDFLAEGFSVLPSEPEIGSNRSTPTSLRIAYGPPWLPLTAGVTLGIVMLGLGGFLLWLG